MKEFRQLQRVQSRKVVGLLRNRNISQRLEQRLQFSHPTRLTEFTQPLSMAAQRNKELTMGMLEMLLLIIVVLMLLGSAPVWPHSRSWGYGPSGGLVTLLLIILLFVLLF